MALAMASAVFRQARVNPKIPVKMRKNLAFFVRRREQLSGGSEALLVYIIEFDSRDGITGRKPLV